MASAARSDDGDVIGSTHRAHGHVLANGTPPNEVMAELYGKVEGCSHGYGGSMHLYDVERGNMGANAVVGGGLPAMVGAALAFKLRGAAARRGRVLRRRRDEQRRLPRVAEPGPALAGAGRLRLREQPLGRVDAAVPAPADRGPDPARGAYGMRTLARGRAGRRGSPSGRARGARARPLWQGPGLPALRDRAPDRPLHRRSAGLPRQGRAAELQETRDPIDEPARAARSSSEEEWAELDDRGAGVVDASLEFARAGTDPDPNDALEYVYAEHQ